jgi:F-type H+-transporting ATPase subunit epsilon
MAEDKVEFELVSPEELLVTEAVEMVVIPGEEGDFGVLPRHAPMLSTVRPGVISIYENNAVRDRIFVAGGFAEVTPKRCTVLAEMALPVADIDRADAEQKLGDARDDLKDAKDDTERRTAERQVAAYEAMLAASA